MALVAPLVHLHSDPQSAKNVISTRIMRVLRLAVRTASRMDSTPTTKEDVNKGAAICVS